jgi:ribosomal protein S18 acetylase RimI-like enzyme
VVDVALLDELGANATPATAVQLLDGWLLRVSPSLPFRRANSVFPNRGVGGIDARRLATVESFYGRHDAPARYHVSPAAQPAGLDAALEAAGYEIDAPVHVLVADTARIARGTGGGDVTASVDGTLPDAWVTAYGDRRLAAYCECTLQLGAHAFAATVDLDGAPAGAGFGVVQREWLGVFGMTTQPAVRRRGIARAVLHALAACGTRLGATSTYLQVEVDNVGARALYERVGFAHAYGYHYRVKR